MEKPKLYVKNEKGRYEPYREPEPPYNNVRYRKYTHGNKTYYDPVSMCIEQDLDEGVNADVVMVIPKGAFPKEDSAAYNRYKEHYNPDCKMYSIDLAGYGTLQVPEKDVYCLAGFSEKIFDVMKYLEEDKDALLNMVKSYNL